MVDVLLGQDGELDDIRLEIAEDLLRDGGPSSLVPPPECEPDAPSRPPPPQPPVTVDPVGDAADASGNAAHPEPATLIDAAIGSLADATARHCAGLSAIEPAGSLIGPLSWPLVTAAFGMTTLSLT